MEDNNFIINVVPSRTCGRFRDYPKDGVDINALISKRKEFRNKLKHSPIVINTMYDKLI